MTRLMAALVALGLASGGAAALTSATLAQGLDYDTQTSTDSDVDTSDLDADDAGEDPADTSGLSTGSLDADIDPATLAPYEEGAGDVQGSGVEPVPLSKDLDIDDTPDQADMDNQLSTGDVDAAPEPGPAEIDIPAADQDGYGQ